MNSEKQISFVVGSYNRKSFLKQMIFSLRKEMENSSIDYEIIIVDGGSTDGTIQWLSKQKDIILILQHNRGFWKKKLIARKSWGYFMNLGFKCAQGKYICMLSDDCLVVPSAIINGFKLFEEKKSPDERVGAIAFYWRNYPEDKKYFVGLTLGNKMFVNHGIYLTKALRDVDFIDENTYMFYHADGDLSLKLWKNGYSIIDSPNSYIEHYSHANIQIREGNLNVAKNDWNNYLKKWENIFYFPSDSNTGIWIYKEFVDENKTAENFFPKERLKKIIEKVKNKEKIPKKVAHYLSKIAK